MQVLKAGTKVKTVIGNIEGIIVSVCITVEMIEYKIRYFANGDEKVSWLFDFEIEVCPTKKEAGFNKPLIEDVKLIEI